jgi:hypothetical protein
MNVNTIKLVSSLEELFDKCFKTAWKHKFVNYWNECDTWCEYRKYYYLADKIAQVYIIDTPYIKAGSILKFPLPVKTYEPDLFFSFHTNQVQRQIEGVKGYVVGDVFITKQDIYSKELKFYLTSDVKVPPQYILSKLKKIYLNFDITLPIIADVKWYRYRHIDIKATCSVIGISHINRDRYVDAKANISLSTDLKVIRDIGLTSVVSFPVLGTADIQQYNITTDEYFINANADISVIGIADIQVEEVIVNCGIWQNVNDWSSINNWEDFYNCGYDWNSFDTWVDFDVWNNLNTWDNYDTWGDFGVWI